MDVEEKQPKKSGRFGRIITPETRKKISISMKKYMKSRREIDKTGGDLSDYMSGL